MFEDNRLASHLNHGVTTFAGLLTMLNGQALAIVGAIVGLGGLLCSISREVRGFLDYRDRRRNRGS